MPLGRRLFSKGLGLHQLPVVGRSFQNPFEVQKLEAMQDAAAQTQAMRPLMAEAQAQAAQQTASLFDPVSQALENMYGPGAAMDLSAAYASPVSPEMMGIAPPAEQDPLGGRLERADELMDYVFGEPEVSRRERRDIIQGMRDEGASRKDIRETRGISGRLTERPDVSLGVQLGTSF